MRSLGHRVVVGSTYRHRRCDLLVALHARHSRAAVEGFRARFPGRPIVLTLTGTDLYGDLREDPRTREVLEWATRLVVLQPLGVDELPAPLRAKTRVIYQSATPPPNVPPPRTDVFEVCVIGHLRPVKDPFRAAWAARRLPASSRIRVLHLGGALSDDMAAQARAEMAVNPRYRWLGELPRWKTLRFLARARLLVHSSEMEGGANVLSEAIACGTPVLASDIPGNVGLLGPDYPGYFPVGDTEALAALMDRAETDPEFYRALQAGVARQKPLVDPARERQSWAELLTELFGGSAGGGVGKAFGASR